MISLIGALWYQKKHRIDWNCFIFYKLFLYLTIPHWNISNKHFKFYETLTSSKGFSALKDKNKFHWADFKFIKKYIQSKLVFFRKRFKLVWRNFERSYFKWCSIITDWSVSIGFGFCEQRIRINLTDLKILLITINLNIRAIEFNEHNLQFIAKLKTVWLQVQLLTGLIIITTQ